MKKVIVYSSLVLVAVHLLGCSARQVQSGPITSTPSRPDAEVPVIPKHEVIDAESEISVDEISELNDEAGTPSFGIIKGFYQLPEAFPHGAISVERERGFGFDYQSVKISKLGTKPYVVTPASGPETEAMSRTMNRLLDANVRFVEVSLADANKIMQAERAAMRKKTMMFPGTSVPSGVDLLLSVEKGYGSYGPIYVGRVIRTKDGQLCALSTVIDAGPTSLGPLVSKLVKDSLRRLSAKK
jgi:hypothetical protein